MACAFLLIVISFAVAGIFFVKNKVTTLSKVNPADNCLFDQTALARHTVLLVDATDKFSSRQKLDLSGIIQTIFGQLDAQERLSVIVLGGQQPPSIPVPVISICAPASDRSLGLAGQLAEPSFLRQQYEKWVEDKEPAVYKIVSTEQPSVGDSAILEYISSISNWTEFGPSVPYRHLIIISDLLQNVPGSFPQNVSVPNFQQFENSPYYQTIESNLSGVDVTVYYLQRNKYRRFQTDAQRQFWLSYFQASNARLIPSHFVILYDDAPVTTP
jgi:hypothetical protein